MDKPKKKRTPTSFTLSDMAKDILKLLAEDDSRSQAKMLEVLIMSEAKRRGIKLP